MSCCARCGQGICSTAGKIALNKVWHKGCFCCYNCNQPLNVASAKIYYGEVFCSCCCPQEVYPLKICRVSSTPSFNPDCCPRMIQQQVCCNSSDSDYCHPRDVHSCSCIPTCCSRTPSPSPCNCRNCCEEICFKRIHCTPRPPRPVNYPPRQRCTCSRCSPKRRPCPDPCRRPCPDPCRRPCRRPCPDPCTRKPRCCSPPPTPCCDARKKMIYFQPCVEKQPCFKCCNSDRCKTERCTRCGEKVFAAEKVLTTHGAYHLGCFSCYCCCRSLCVKSMFEACGEIYCKQCYNNYFGIGGYGYTC